MKQHERFFLGSGFFAVGIIWFIAILLLGAVFDNDHLVIPTPRTLEEYTPTDGNIFATLPPTGHEDGIEIIASPAVPTHALQAPIITPNQELVDRDTHTINPDVTEDAGDTPVNLPLDSNRVPSVVVLHYSPGTTPAELDAYAATFNAEIETMIPELYTAIVRLPDAGTRLPSTGFIRAIEPDFYLSALEVPNDPEYATQWNLDVIDAPLGWDLLPEDVTPINVAVVDSGICFNHADLQGRILDNGWDFVDDDNDATDEYGHGCQVAGVLAANRNNRIAIAGVAPHVQILPLRVLDNRGAGTYSRLAQAIVYAVDNGAQLINLSLGGTAQSTLLSNALAYAENHGVLVIAAAGNQGSTQTMYPAAYPSVIAVGAVNQDLQRASFSNYGDWVDIYAPGTAIRSLSLDGGVTIASGTSLATPQVTGVAAIEMALGRALVVDGSIVRVQPQNSLPPVESGATCDSPEITTATAALDALVAQYLADPASVTEAELDAARSAYLDSVEVCYSTAYVGDIAIDGGAYHIESAEPVAQYNLFGTKWGTDSPFNPAQPPGTPGGRVTYSFMPANIPVVENRLSRNQTPPLTFRFGRLNTADAETELCLQEYARDVIAEWSDIANIELEEVPDSGVPFNDPRDHANHIRIGFIQIDRPGKELAHAYFPPEEDETNTGVGDIFFDVSEDWGWHCVLNADDNTPANDRPITQNGRIDFGFVLRHELGHALGLGHQEVSRYSGEAVVPSVMYGKYGAMSHVLQPDDIAGLRAIYGTDSLTSLALNIPIVTQNLVELSWSAASGGNPDSYQIQVAIDEGDNPFAEPILDAYQTATSRTLSGLFNEDYIWRVRGYRTGEGWGPWSGTTNTTFTISIDVPILLRPANQQNLRSGVVEFRWSEITPNTQYILQIDDTDLFANPLVFTTQTIEPSFETSGSNALVDGDYYWRVRTATSAADDWSEVFHFRVDSNIPVPNTPSDENCALQPVTETSSTVLVCTTNTLTLDWNPADGAVEYEIHMDTSPYYVGLLFLDTLFLDTLYGDSLFLDTLFLDTLYGDSLFLDTLFLDTLFLDTLFLDTLFLDTLFLDTLFLDTLFLDTLFLDTLFLDTQRLESVFADRLFLDTVFFDRIQGTSKTVTHLTDGYHYWRVRAVYADGRRGAWSTSSVFVVDTERNDVVINEIYPGNPQTNDPAWIELVNTSPRGIVSTADANVNLGGWEVILYNPQGAEFFRYTFDMDTLPTQFGHLLTLEPGEYLVLMAADAPASDDWIPNTIYLGTDSITGADWILEENPNVSPQTNTATLNDTTTSGFTVVEVAYVSADTDFTGIVQQQPNSTTEAIAAANQRENTALPETDDSPALTALTVELDDHADETIGAMAADGGIFAAAEPDVMTVETTFSEFSDNDLCSLPEAIINANNDTAVWDDCPAGDGADTIELAANATYALTSILDTSEGNNGLPSITSEIIINGNNATIQRDVSGDAFRIFHVAASGNLTLNDMTIQSGFATGVVSPHSFGGGIYTLGAVTLNYAVISNNSASGFGGGIFINTGGTVTATNLLIDNNSSSSQGGGIFNNSASLIMTSSTVSNNFADGQGAGIHSSFGNVTLNATTVSDNSTNGNGGGIFSTGTLTITDSIIQSNISDYGAGILNEGILTLADSPVTDNSAQIDGGGIFNYGGEATLTNATISNNSTLGSGGGISNSRSGTVILNNSTVTDNQAANSGGGIYTSSGDIILLNSTIQGNNADYGAGIFSDYFGTIDLSNSTVSSNVANSSGGGIHSRGESTLTNSTISGNLANSGGGIYNVGNLSLTSSTLADNSAITEGGGIYNAFGTVTLNNSIVANSFNGDCGGGVLVIGTNFDTDGSCGGAIIGAITVTSGQLNLSPLDYYGGATPTHQLGTGSVAINAVAGADCTVATDQRGLPRPNTVANRCDVGAYEVDQSALQTPPNYTVNSVYSGDDGLCTIAQCTLTEAINAANADGVASTITLVSNETYYLQNVEAVARGDNGLPFITTPIEIIGNGATIRRHVGAVAFRILYVDSTGDLTLNNLTLDYGYAQDDGAGLLIVPGGYAELNNVNMTNNWADYFGGAIYNEGTLEIFGGSFTGNHANVAGGAISNRAGTLTVENATFSDNSVLNDGGAIGNELGAITVADSTFSGNQSGNDGGALYNAIDGILTLTNVDISNNTASMSGGGIYNSFGSILSLTDSTVSANSANQYGGGIYNVGNLLLTNTPVSYNAASISGGGIWNAGGGTLELYNSTISGNTASRFGGGIFNFSQITVTDSEVSNNTAVELGGGIYNFSTATLTNIDVSGNAARSGAGILNSGTATITDSTLDNNTAEQFGGGMYSNRGTLTILNTDVLNNASGIYGGGIHNTSTVNLTDSTVDGNSSSLGGGLGNFGILNLTETIVSNNIGGFAGGGIENGGTATLTDSTITGNQAINHTGGGIRNETGRLTITGSLIANNTAVNATSGGIHNAGILTITNSTFSGNVSKIDGIALTNWGELRLTNATIYANQSTGDSPNRSSLWNNYYFDARNTIIAGSINSSDCYLTGDGLSVFGTNFNSDGTCDDFTTVPAALNLDVLADNGGITQTHALLSDSVAIDAVAGGDCTTGFDQRGALRPNPVGGLCDAGAYEFSQTSQAAPDYTVNTTDMRDDRSCTVEHCSLIDAINAANADGVASSIELQDGAVYTLNNVIDTTDGNNGLPSITSAMTINANNATIVRNEQNSGDGSVGLWTSLQLASNGNAIVSYYDSVDDVLKLAVCDTALCENPYVTIVDDGDNVGQYTSLALNSAGNPIISYAGTDGSGLQLAICDNLLCLNPLILTLDNEASPAYISLTLDAADNPVISYRDNNSDSLQLITCESPICDSSVRVTVDSSNDALGEYTSLVLDDDGTAFISYYDSQNEDLKLAVCDSVCAAYVVDSTDNVGLFTSIELDSNGNPVISYFDFTNTSLKLAVCNDAVDCDSPVIRTVHSGINVGQFSSLELAANDNPIISYWNLTYGFLEMAVCSDPTCDAAQIITVDGDEDGVGMHTSLALNNYGYPIISYLGNGNLKLATCDALICPLPTLRYLDGHTSTPAFRIFHVAASGDLTLNDVTSSNGFTAGATIAGDGAGIYNLGTLIMTNSTVSNNTAVSNGHGGGIFNDNLGILTMTNSKVANNSAADNGGGIVNRGTLTMTNSIVSINSANRNGGGILNLDGILTMTDGSISNNRGENGGGIRVCGGVLNLTGTAITDNAAEVDGGGIEIDCEGDAVLTNVTISDNIRGSYGGGISIYDATVNIYDSIISGNSSSGTNPLTSGGGGVSNIGGLLQIENSFITNNMSDMTGGGLDTCNGYALVRDTVITGNSANTAGGVGHGCGGTLELHNVTIQQNSAVENGAGMWSDAPSAIFNSIISENIVAQRGGGIYNLGELTIARSTISNNRANGTAENSGGGGIFHVSGDLSIADSLMDGNEAHQLGGGLFVEVGASFDITRSTFLRNVSTNRNGGAAEIRGTGTITNSTITRNRAEAGTIGGIIINNADLTLNNVTVAYNEAFVEATELGVFAGTMRLRNTIVAGNTEFPLCATVFGNIVDEDNNLQYRTTSPVDDSCGMTIPVANPQLGELTGSIFFYPLLFSSPARDTGNPATCEIVDQRNQPRNDGTCDIGAYEYADSLQTGGNYTVNVTTMDDDSLCGVLHCSLIEAVDAANAFGAASTITLDAGQQYILTDTHTTRDGGNGLPLITGHITLYGNESIIARSDSGTPPEFRIFYVTEGANLNLRNVRLMNGRAATLGGGAILNRGTLMLDNVQLSDNRGANGGAIRSGITGAPATNLTISASKFENNIATDTGGAIAIYDGTLTITTTTIDNNRADNDGGGIYSNNSVATINRSTISYNTSPNGAGVSTVRSNLVLQNTTLSHNTIGSGFYQHGGTATLRHVTIAYNAVGLNVGGDTSTGVTIVNSLLANNPNGADPTPDAATRVDCSQSIDVLSQQIQITVTGSLATDTECAYIDPTANPFGFMAVPPADVALLELGNYGGLTQTHALPTNSIAVDYNAIVQNACSAVQQDQRGIRRQVDTCDVGAFEQVNVVLPTIGTTGGSVALMQPSDDGGFDTADFVHFGTAIIPAEQLDNSTGTVVSLPLDAGRSIGRDPVGGDTDDRTDWFTQMPTRGGQNAVKLVINEIYTGDIDAIEIYNPSIHPVDVSGWQLRMSREVETVDANGVTQITTATQTYTFAQGIIFPPGAFVVLKEGTPPFPHPLDDPNVYMGFTVNWSVSGARGVVELTNGVSGVDFMRFGDSLVDDTGAANSPLRDITPTTGTRWLEDLRESLALQVNPVSPLPHQSIGRDNRSTDSDTGYDWIPQASTLGARNLAEALPPNDEFDFPVIIPYMPFRDIRSVQAATLDSADPVDQLQPQCGVAIHHTIWYKLPPQGTDKPTTFQTDGSSYATSLSVWRLEGNQFMLEGCDYNSRGENTRSQVTINTNGDETYYIMVGSTYGLAGRLVFSVDPPANDDFGIFTSTVGEADAELGAAEFTITTLPYSDSQLTRAASSAPDDPRPQCGTMVGRSIWYRFEPQTDQAVRLHTEGSNYDTVIAVYTGSRGHLLPFACGNDTLTSSVSELQFRPVPGTIFWIMVAGNNDSAGNLVFQLEHVTPPVNDNWENALDVTSLNSGSFTHQVDTYGATNQVHDPLPQEGNRPRNSVWYRYTGITSARVTFETLTSNYNTVLSVWTTAFDGDTMMPNDFVHIASNDDVGIGDRTSRLTIQPVPGETYYVMVSGYLGDTGTLNFSAYYPDAPPLNDLRSNAREIPTLAADSSWIDPRYATSGATITLREVLPSCIPIATGTTVNPRFNNSVWYVYQAGDDQQQLHFTTVGSLYDTVLTVWVVEVDAVGSPIIEPTTGLPRLSEVGCNNDSNSNRTSSLVVPSGRNTILYIQVTSYLAGGGLLNFKATALPQPPVNDLRSGVKSGDTITPTFDVNPFYTYADSTVQATSSLSDPNPSCGLTVGNTVWFYYEADSDATLLLDTQGSQFDTVLSIWQIADDDTLSMSERACDNDSGAGSTSLIEFEPTVGAEYFIMLGGENRENGEYNFNVEVRTPPDNDERSNAIDIRQLLNGTSQQPVVTVSDDGSHIEVVQSSRGATTNTNDPTSCNVTVGRTIWYRYATGASDEIVQLSTAGSNFNTVIAIFNGNELIACEDNNGTGFTELIAATRLAANTTYTIMLGGAFAETGNVHLALDIVLPPDNDEKTSPRTVFNNEPLNTTYATRNAVTDGMVCGTSPQRTVWYEYTPDTDSTLSLSLAGTAYNTVIAVFNGDSLVSCAIGQQHTHLTVSDNTYFIMIGSSGGVGGTLYINATAAETPINDISTQPVIIPMIPAFDVGTPYSNSQSTIGATTEVDANAICDVPVGKGVWYQYTAVAGDGLLVFDLSASNYSTLLVVFPDDGTMPFCREAERVEFAAREGTTYLMMIAGINGASGELTLTAYQYPRPQNDDFDNAALVTPLPYTHTVNTRGASDMPADPASCSVGSGKSVWYAYASLGSGALTINAHLAAETANNPATVISVYTGEYGGLTPVGCGTGTATANVQPLQTYYILITDMANTGGDLTVTMSGNIVPPAPALSVDLTSSVGSIAEPGGSVSFTATITNDSVLETVTITALMGDVRADIATLCGFPIVLAPSATTTCTFDYSVSGVPFVNEVHTVTANGTTNTGVDLVATGSLTLIIADVPSSLAVTLVADVPAVTASGTLVNFTATIENTSPVDTVTITSIVDAYGTAIDGCTEPDVLLPGDIMTCRYQRATDDSAGFVNIFTVLATGIDDDNQPVQSSAATQVLIQCRRLNDRHDVDVNFEAPYSTSVITNNSPDCVYSISMVVYSQIGRGRPQWVLADSITRLILPGASATLGIDVPRCRSEIMVIEGEILADSTQYGNRRLEHQNVYQNVRCAVENDEVVPLADASLIIPANLSAAATETQVLLSWVDNNPDETHTFVERQAGDGSWFTLATLGENAVSFMDSNLACATTYTYRLWTSNDMSVSDFSDVLSVTTNACIPPTTIRTVAPEVINVQPVFVGLYRDGVWRFRNGMDETSAEVTFNFGLSEAGWQAVVGDWNGDGVDGLGLYKAGIWILRDTTLTNMIITFGEAGWQAMVGDWNGDGVDGLGLYQNGQWQLYDIPSQSSMTLAFGIADPNARPVAGDWNQDGFDTPGLYVAGQWVLLNDLSSTSHTTLAFGTADTEWIPIAGDWNGDNTETVGLFNNGMWRLRNALVDGQTDVGFSFGFNEGGWMPVTGFNSSLEALAIIGTGGSVTLPEVSVTNAPTAAVTIEIVPTETPEVTPEVTDEVIPTAMPEATIEIVPTAMPEVIVEVIPTAMPEVTIEVIIIEATPLPPHVQICHATGAQDSTVNNWVVLELPHPSLFNHFDESLNPLAGHEHDFIITAERPAETCR